MEQRQAGRALRAKVPRSSHARYEPSEARSDPVAALREQSRAWLPELVDLRFRRMLASPLAYLRGSAAIMAADLAATPRTGLAVQAAGDAHLLNFGGVGTPERRLVFDVEDFDETLPGPWEWDVKRLAASVVVAGRELGLDPERTSNAARAVGRAYRKGMRRFAKMTALEVFGFEMRAEEIAGRLAPLRQAAETWSERTDRWELPRLTSGAGGSARIVARPPLTEPAPESLAAALFGLPRRYAGTLAGDRAALLRRYEVVDVARHAVGVGSFGTRCFVILLSGSDRGDPLFLQVKEARASALAAELGGARIRHQGRRVVAGQRLAQAGSDPLLGWGTLEGLPVYVRQLRDMRGAIDLDRLKEGDLARYAKVCARALARAHARTGSPARIAGYLGRGDVFDDALGRFAHAYADQTERDHAALLRGVQVG